MFEILNYEWMQHAIYAGFIIGLISPLVGLHLVVRRLSMMSEGLSHITLSGVAAGMLVQKKLTGFQDFNPLYMGMIFSVISSLFMENLRRFYRTYKEIAIPILMSGGVALGVILISAGNGFNVDIAGYLFGNIIAVKSSDLWSISIIGAIVLIFLAVFHKELFAISFDEEYAFLSGIPRKFLNFLFMIILALVISASLRAVGILLVSALMTIPVAASLKLTNSFTQAMWLSVAFSQISVFSGLFISTYFDLAPGGSIVLTSIFILIVVLLGQNLYLRVKTK